MASAQVDAAPVEEVIVQDKNLAEGTHVDEQTLPKSLEESDVVYDHEGDELGQHEVEGEVKSFEGDVVYDHEEDELAEHEVEGEAKSFEDEENLDNKFTDSPIIGVDEPNSTFNDDDDAEEEEESDKL